jgi:hypothetical protein
MITAFEVLGSAIKYCHVPDVFSNISWMVGLLLLVVVAVVYAARLDVLGPLFDQGFWFHSGIGLVVECRAFWVENISLDVLVIEALAAAFW